MCELANRQLRRLLANIEDLGLLLQIAVISRRGVLGGPEIKVGRYSVKVSNRMRYLGVILDSKLTFESHLEFVEDKAAKMLRSLGKLMPNLRDPSQHKRMLYYNVFLSIVLYGALI